MFGAPGNDCPVERNAQTVAIIVQNIQKWCGFYVARLEVGGWGGG